jgi:hypothetical protein
MVWVRSVWFEERAVKFAQAAVSETEPHHPASPSLQRESRWGSPLARGRSDEPGSRGPGHLIITFSPRGIPVLWCLLKCFGVFPSLVFVALVAAFSGCAAETLSERPSSSSRSEQSPSNARFGHDLTGVWEGGSACRLGRYSSNCRGTRNIAFTFVTEEGSSAAGFYRCATGTVSCRNQLETGSIARTDWKGERLWLRVMLGDGSSCLFTSILGPDKLAGGYECLQGASLVEQGRWWAERSY